MKPVRLLAELYQGNFCTPTRVENGYEFLSVISIGTKYKQSPNHLELKWTDDEPVTPMTIHHILEWAWPMRTKEAVLIRCEAGLNRSTMLCVCAIIYLRQWTLADAMQHFYLCRWKKEGSFPAMSTQMLDNLTNYAKVMWDERISL
jgi:protein-tyrosine phosphatase